MLSFFLSAILSVLSALGMATIIVEKGDKFPVSLIKKPLSWLLIAVHPKVSEVLECTVCLSFWTTALTDLVIFLFVNKEYFFWPLSGFISCFIAWVIYEILNAIAPVQTEEHGLD